MEVELSLEAMKRILQEADVYEQSMTTEEIKEHYNFISDHKDATSDGNKSGRLSESQQDFSNALNGKSEMNRGQDSFVPKNWSGRKTNENKAIKLDEDSDDFDLDFKKGSSQSSKPSNEDIPDGNNRTDKESIEDASKWSFGYDDMLGCTENTLRFIPRKLLLVPIQATKAFLNADNHEKAKMLYAYHTKINVLRAQAARQSFSSAPMPTAISLDEHSQDYFDNSETKETYVSRSGRLTKRKVYYENEDSCDGILSTTKKSKNEVEWSDKEGDKIKLETKISRKKQDNDRSNLGAAVDEEHEVKKVVDENRKQSPVRAKQKKLTNSEIISRSRLFADSPPKLSRSDVIFDKLKEQGETRKKQEKAREQFERTLETLDEEQDNKDEVISVDDEKVVPRRVIPPLPGRKPIHRRRNKSNELTALDVKISKANSSQINTPSPPSMELPKTVRKKQINKSHSDIQIENAAVPTSKDQITSNTVECPMCGKYFMETKIEAHAWTCSDDQPPSRSSPRTKTPATRITCPICDIVVPLTTNYDIHVKECTKKKELESQNT